MLLLQMMEPCSGVHEPENTKAASAWNTQRQAAPRHPQAFLPTATQHHSGLIHVDEDSCLVPNGPSRFGPLQVPCCLTTGSNHWTKNTRRNPKTVQILGPVLRSIFGPQNGPQVGCLIKNPIEARFRGPFLGPFLGPKIGTRN